MEFKAAPSEDSKNYATLKNGDSIRGVFLGNLYEFYTHWVGTKSDLCTTPTCAHCLSGNKRKFRFRVNLLVLNPDKTFTAKIFEQGGMVYAILRDLNAEYDLEKNLMKITRSGTGMDTTYSILPVPNGAVTPEIEARLAQVKLLDLRPTPKEQAHSLASQIPDFNHNEPLPF